MLQEQEMQQGQEGRLQERLIDKEDSPRLHEHSWGIFFVLTHLKSKIGLSVFFYKDSILVEML